MPRFCLDDVIDWLLVNLGHIARWERRRLLERCNREGRGSLNPLWWNTLRTGYGLYVPSKSLLLLLHPRLIVNCFGILLVQHVLFGLFFDLATLFGQNRIRGESASDLAHFAHSLLDLLNCVVIEVAIRGHLETLKLRYVFATADQDQTLMYVWVLAHMRQSESLIVKHIGETTRTAELIH